MVGGCGLGGSVTVPSFFFWGGMNHVVEIYLFSLSSCIASLVGGSLALLAGALYRLWPLWFLLGVGYSPGLVTFTSSSLMVTGLKLFSLGMK
jgi:hypothetical protein